MPLAEGRAPRECPFVVSSCLDALCEDDRVRPFSVCQYRPHNLRCGHPRGGAHKVDVEFDDVGSNDIEQWQGCWVHTDVVEGNGPAALVYSINFPHHRARMSQ